MVIEDFVILFADSHIASCARDEPVELVAEERAEHVGVAACAEEDFVSVSAGFVDSVDCALWRSVLAWFGQSAVNVEKY